MYTPHFVGAPPLGTLDLTEPFQMLLIVDFQKRFRIVRPISLSCSESFPTSIRHVIRHTKVESGGDVEITRDILFLKQSFVQVQVT
jgi:hypothetical protein